MGRAGLPSRAITCPPFPPPHPPLLQREFQSERARGLLPGRNHPAQRRGVGRRHLTARPRPPRVRGGGSVCSVTNGPSRSARPLARARRGPARDRSSQQMPGSHRPIRPPRRARSDTRPPQWVHRAPCDSTTRRGVLVTRVGVLGFSAAEV